MTTSRRIPRKRAYLAKDARHAALLDAAAAVVEAQGWPALSMIAVAQRAKVSRQLVYEHFASVDELMTQTMSHLFSQGYEALRDTIRRSPGNVADMTSAAERIFFGDQEPGRVRALWQMITATHSENAETSRMSRRLRHLVTNLWTPIVRQSMGLDESESRIMTWMLNMAFWGAHQLVDEGEADRVTALRLFNWMVVQLQAGSVLSPPLREGKASRRKVA